MPNKDVVDMKRDIRSITDEDIENMKWIINPICVKKITLGEANRIGSTVSYFSMNVMKIAFSFGSNMKIVGDHDDPEADDLIYEAIYYFNDEDEKLIYLFKMFIDNEDGVFQLVSRYPAYDGEVIQHA